MTEKIAYIKGLAEGLELDSSKNEVKVINQILELLDQMAAEVE
ncbi:MAG: CD1247 N-terminal domain-containing protein, partial [Ruminococcus sp.]